MICFALTLVCTLSTFISPQVYTYLTVPVYKYTDCSLSELFGTHYCI